MRKNFMKRLNPKTKEVKIMKRMICTAICAVFLLMASVAFAALTPITVVTSDGTVTNVGQFDEADGSTLGVNANPVDTATFVPGAPIQTLYQARMAGFNDTLLASLASSFPNLNINYEFTVTAGILETFSLSPDNTVALFGLSPNPANMINVYYDTTPDSNVLAGTGFTDGTLALTAHPIFLQGVYTAADTNGNTVIDNQDIGSGSTTIIASIDTVDASVFPSLSPGDIWRINFIATENTPPVTYGVDTNLMFNGRVPNYFGMSAAIGGPGTPQTTSDVLFAADGNNTFQIPEPSMIILVGSGLIGLGLTARRKRKK